MSACSGIGGTLCRGFTPADLAQAWQKVHANGGAPGGDGMKLEIFAIGLDRRLAGLADGVASGCYRPGPLRRVRVAKPAGGFRELAIPCIGDRVVQTAALTALAPQVDRRMSPGSFAYRPGRSVPQALALARSFAAGKPWVLDADVERFFDSVPHRQLLQELAIWIDDVRLFWLAGMWVCAAGAGRGLPQGSPISPLFANLYLHPVDKILAVCRIAAVRYADDFVCLCRTPAEAVRARSIVESALASRGLVLSRGKTRVVHASAGIPFLGDFLFPPPARQPQYYKAAQNRPAALCS